jgi:hypothetical protein
MNTQLVLKQNLDDFETFYDMLGEAHAGLDQDQRGILDAQLILLLANHIGDMAVLRQAFALARLKLDIILSN